MFAACVWHLQQKRNPIGYWSLNILEYSALSSFSYIDGMTDL